jgi:acetoin utilization deacetylase AcuC-like enzyme
MKVFRSEQHRLHFPKGELYGGVFVRPFECPERWDFINQALLNSGYADIADPGKLDMSILSRVHSKDYLRFLQEAWDLWEAGGFEGDAIPTVFPARRMQQREPDDIDGKLGYFAMAIETSITAGTWDAAISSAACAQAAASHISEGASSAFSLCRPPGHHAGIDLYGGYCFLNNAAIAAETLLSKGAKKISILDVDFHHGNGTQDIFYQRDDVQFISLHGDPKDVFPNFLGYADEKGEGKGLGYNINYPMPPNTPYGKWKEALNESLRAIEIYKPDALVISLGVDTFELDPISFFKLKSDDFIDYGNALAALKLPTAFIMEGGYAVEEIGTNTVNVLDGFVGS